VDERAFETIYDRHYRLVFGVALRILDDRAAAEDVTQAVFLKLWSDPDAFRGGNLAGWLARVSRNRALDVVRSKAIRATDTIPADVPLDETLDETVFARIERARIRSALDALPEEQSIPITLGFFGGITHEEIARRLGIPLGTIKSRIRLGLRRLRTDLEAMVSS